MSRAHRYLPALLLIGTALTVTPACASGYYGGYRQGGVYRADIERRAYDYGYREGLKRGDEDGRKHRSYSYDRHGEYRHADDGYHRDYGSREYYQRSYRQGFERGYREGFDRYTRGYRRY